MFQGLILFVCHNSLLYLGAQSSELHSVRQETTPNAATMSAHCTQTMELTQGTLCNKALLPVSVA